MSWNAYLIAETLDGHGFAVADFNYTHNCNRMAAHVLRTHGQDVAHAWFDGDREGTQWWMALDGMTGKESLVFFDTIIGGLVEAPALFREMNPENGWGDYDSFLARLAQMQNVAAEHPSATWRTNG